MSAARIFIGDCREQMKKLAGESVDCVVTSPPYFGLRDYGNDDQIGLEPTVDEFVASLVSVFREVRRCLKPTGTVWLNLGDSYASNIGSGQGLGGQMATRAVVKARRGRNRPEGFKSKDLIGIPWRVAFALQSDGWYLRQDIIWHKPNAAPESVKDRCTKAHEYVFLLSKSPRYYFDSKAIAEKATGRESASRPTRNKRSVWTVSTRPFKGAHFATFPAQLVVPCVLAGCPPGGVVLDPFGGAGTTAIAANRHHREAILCELNPDYAELAAERIRTEAGMLSDVRIDDGFEVAQ